MDKRGHQIQARTQRTMRPLFIESGQPTVFDHIGKE
jgi:hypothetical protein